MIARRAGIVVLLGLTIAAAALADGPESADQAARRCLELLRIEVGEKALACFDPDSLPENADDLLPQLHEALQIGDTLEYQVVNRGIVNSIGQGRTDTLVYHVRGDSKALLVIAQVREIEGAPALVGLHWEPVPLDLLQRYPFTFDGVPALYYGVLALAVATPFFMLYAAIVCFRRKPHRWGLWLLFILLGVGKLSVVWLPGPLNLDYIRIVPISVQLLGVAFNKMPIYAPWTVSFSFPLGAALFLWRQRAGRVAEASMPAAERGAAADEPPRAAVDP